MKHRAKYSMIFLMALYSLGCGSDKSGPGSSAAYQKDSRSCSPAFVTDYNSLISAFKSAIDLTDLDRVEKLVNEFEGKYKGVVCDASRTDSGGYSSSVTTVYADSEVSKWRDSISKVRNAAAAARNQAGSSGGNSTRPAPVKSATPPSVSTPATVSPPATGEDKPAKVATPKPGLCDDFTERSNAIKALEDQLAALDIRFTTKRTYGFERPGAPGRSDWTQEPAEVVSISIPKALGDFASWSATRELARLYAAVLLKYNQDCAEKLSPDDKELNSVKANLAQSCAFAMADNLYGGILKKVEGDLRKQGLRVIEIPNFTSGSKSQSFYIWDIKVAEGVPLDPSNAKVLENLNIYETTLTLIAEEAGEYRKATESLKRVEHYSVGILGDKERSDENQSVLKTYNPKKIELVRQLRAQIAAGSSDLKTLIAEPQLKELKTYEASITSTCEESGVKFVASDDGHISMDQAFTDNYLKTHSDKHIEAMGILLHITQLQTLTEFEMTLAASTTVNDQERVKLLATRKADLGSLEQKFRELARKQLANFGR